MKYIEAGVTYRKAVSDEHYGTESAEVHLSATLDPEDNAGVEVEDMLETACSLAFDQLSKSVNAAVRRAVEAPKKRPPVPSMHTEVEEEIPF